jgi:hypothetical protein
VVDDVALVDQLVDDRGRHDRLDDQVVVAPLEEMRDVLDGSVEMSSSAYTSQPSASSSSERCEPIKPAPPVTSAFLRLADGTRAVCPYPLPSLMAAFPQAASRYRRTSGPSGAVAAAQACADVRTASPCSIGAACSVPPRCPP